MTALWTTADLHNLFGAQAKELLQPATGVSIDTRTLQKGDLFIALTGPVAEGHDHVAQALNRGAAGAIVAQGKGAAWGSETAFRCFEVRDTFEALQQMGQYQRRRTIARVAAVTGSYGKTSCKEALAQLLAHQGTTHATKSSFNNHWGVPLTLSALPPEAAFGIFEIGMNHVGEISPLARQVAPQVALITTVAAAHIGPMGTLQAIAAEKAALFEGMTAGGVAVLNEESAEFDFLKQKAKDRGLEIRCFGRGPRAYARLIHASFREAGLFIQAEIDGHPYNLHLPVAQGHWALSALGVLTTIGALGGDMVQAAQDFSQYILPEGRGTRYEVPYKGGAFTLLDESYNAGPASMQEALQALGRQGVSKDGRRIAVLADMLELGDFSEAAHRALADQLRAAGVEKVYTLGQAIEALRQELSCQGSTGREVALAHHAASTEDLPQLLKALQEDARAGDVYLVKGSRGQRAYRGRLAQVVDGLRSLGDSRDLEEAKTKDPATKPLLTQGVS